MDESIEWFDSQLDKLDTLQFDNVTPEAKLAIGLMKQEVQRDDFWFKKMWNVNLPDVKDGNSILSVNKGKFSIISNCISN